MVFIGNLKKGSNALSMLKGFKELGVHVEAFDTSHFESPPRLSLYWIFSKSLKHQYEGFCRSRIDSILHKQGFSNYDIGFVFKGLFVNALELKKFCKVIAHYHPDDTTGNKNISSIFLNSEPVYDFLFTPKLENLQPVLQRSGRQPIFIRYAYDPDWHLMSEKVKFNIQNEIGFIGNPRKNRRKFLYELHSRIHDKWNIVIAGQRWNRYRMARKKFKLVGPKYGDDFSKFCALYPIQLGLLNDEANDTHTARTFEVPASGALFLAERTQEHLEIFDEGHEAVFFSSIEELVEKLEWVYLNKLEAEKIAQRGYLRIRNGKNTWRDRAFEILNAIDLNLEDLKS